MSQRWSIHLSIEGDLRFCSHRDIMRTLHRVAAIADVPLLYTQGFNPHPILSLASPRPAGVASRDDLLVIRLDDSADEIAPTDLLHRLNARSPRGMRFISAAPLTGRACPMPRQSHYELHLPAERISLVRRRLDELADMDSWPFERHLPPKKRSRHRKPRRRSLNLRPLVAELVLRGQTLQMTLVPSGDLWARPREVLATAGLEADTDLAALVRTSVQYAQRDDGEPPCTTDETS